jgi:hypothetical protein
MKRSSAVFVCMLVATLAFSMALIAIRKHRAHDVARNRLNEAVPAYSAKIDKWVTILRRETLIESAEKLSDVNGFFFAGPTMDIINSENRDQKDIDAILSNRRFLKLLSELRELDKPMASQIVRTNLMSALAGYLRLYDLDLQRRPAPLLEPVPNVRRVCGD